MEALEQLLTLYEQRRISRRDLLGALALVPLGRRWNPALQPAAQGQTLNHVSIGVSDLRRSTEFYDRLLQLPVRDRGDDYCEYRLADGFLGLYKESRMRRGLDHVAIGVDGYEPKKALASIHRALPNASATVEFEDQVYVTDPDGAKIQLCDVNYKR